MLAPVPRLGYPGLIVERSRGEWGREMAPDAAGKLGQTSENGYGYYLWTLTWGLGWVPLLLAFGGDTQLRLTEVQPHGVCAELEFPARQETK